MHKKTKPERTVVEQTVPGKERRRGARGAAVAAVVTAAAVTLQVRERRKTHRAVAEERERVTVKLPKTLIERTRDAVFWTAGLTLTGLIEESLIRAIARLERQRGQPFERRTADLKAGRPTGR